MTTYWNTVVHPDFIGSKDVANAIRQFITGNNVDASNDASVIVTMWALNSCDQGIVLDMRSMNGATKNPAFEPFWKELEHQLHTYKTVHSRRYGKWLIVIAYIFA
jgi:hypothetical protein